MTTLSSHVLDTATGAPARGLRVELLDARRVVLAQATTDDDGRVKGLGPELVPGDYTVVFHTSDYFQSQGQVGFYPKVTVEFHVAGDPHYHVPLLLSPYGYSTYRGS
ncbi:hydroxyisourate hydrolase [Segniliparus rotundus DSM 44985]|uniref:5-hydroxyisourate hydrolase n=1 Tax=Segniliparus rotundus (strain ATCC BAA-972 / CDC 1076 / CIP 108378 / DSM 44985 / JCM 13578) TaxID=640132 RepID=D6ZEL4_SEGRD|nr:hydroxyisourate hydrolase [Segniliparus rotundus]ADG99490.1 hydroxyisourate hydrolase [Segniliparus rotundus DSM 44985]